MNRKHPFRAMCCPVNVYRDRDISYVLIVKYHVLISIQLVSYVVGVQCRLISLRFALRGKASNNCLYCSFYFRPRLKDLIDHQHNEEPNRYKCAVAYLALHLPLFLVFF